MRIDRRWAAPLGLAVLGLGGVIVAPTAAAACNDSSGTVVCAQGDIRGTNGPPPVAPSRGAWGTWCSTSVCYPGYVGSFGGFGVP